jgi:hypothetical protein
VIFRLRGELLSLPFEDAGKPFLAEGGLWADPWIIDVMTVTKGNHIRSIQVDPCPQLLSVTDRPMTWDDDADVFGHVLESLQPDEVVLDRILR